MYYCICSKGAKAPVRIVPFHTEAAARAEAHKLLAHRYEVTVGKFHEVKDAGEGEDAWRMEVTNPAAYEALRLEETSAP
jgi:hypothetical protein